MPQIDGLAVVDELLLSRAPTSHQPTCTRDIWGIGDSATARTAVVVASGPEIACTDLCMQMAVRYNSASHFRLDFDRRLLHLRSEELQQAPRSYIGVEGASGRAATLGTFN